MNKKFVIDSEDLTQIRTILRDKIFELDMKISTIGDFDNYWSCKKVELVKLLNRLEDSFEK